MIPKLMSKFLHDVLPERTWSNRLHHEGPLAFMEFGPLDVDRLQRLGIQVDLGADGAGGADEAARLVRRITPDAVSVLAPQACRNVVRRGMLFAGPASNRRAEHPERPVRTFGGRRRAKHMSFVL